MKERETFLERWSRRKRANAPAEVAEPESKPREEKPAAPLISPASPPSPTELPFDVSKLPPLESITAETDIRAYMAPGVPAELTRAALRRAWAADPQIRDFVGLSENAWDFNAPEGVPGFGPLHMTDELRHRISNMVGRSLGSEAKDEPHPEPQKPQAPVPAKTPEAAENSTRTAENICRTDASTAMQESEQTEQAAPQKRHGGALPT